MVELFKKNIRYISYAFQANRLYSGLIVLLNILANCMPALKILTIGKIIDDISSNAVSSNAILGYIILIISIYLVEYCINAIQSMVLYKFSVIINTYMEDQFYQKLSFVKYSILEDKKNNDLIFKVNNGIEKKFAESFSKILEFIGFLVRVASILLAVISTSIWTGFVLLLILICLTPLYLKMGEENYAAYTEANREYRRAKSFRQIITDREFANERETFQYLDYYNQRWYEKYLSAIGKELKASKKNHLKILFITAMIALLTTLLSGVLIPSLVTGQLSLGVFIITVTQLYNLVHYMSWNFSYLMDDLTENKLYIEDFDVFMHFDEVSKTRNAKIITDGENNYEIVVEHLSFKYPGCEKYVLKDFSFTFSSGKHYAIVGKNGAGKSTLVKLLLGLYDEYEGRILINGIDMRSLAKDDIINIYSVVFQDYAKYALTIMENILLDYPSDAENTQKVYDTLKQLNLFQDIQKLKEGLHTYLGKLDSNGTDLSEGQWQKIAIARCAMVDAGIYILDEPSSSLDPISEKHLYDMYNHVFDKKTTIVITHRLGNTKNQDEIIVLDEGMVAEYGNHSSLMRQKSIYYEMFNKQRGWYCEEKE